VARVGARGAHDRLEAEVREFHDRVRDGYEALLALEKARELNPQNKEATALLAQLRAGSATSPPSPTAPPHAGADSFRAHLPFALRHEPCGAFVP
jgi:cell division septum initiation protein DivIVA